MQLSEGSAIVVVGAGGFGSATVRRLVKAGGHVVIADFDGGRGAALAQELGDRAVFVHTDVTSEESVDSLIARAVERAPLRATVIVHGGPVARRRVVDREGNAYPASTFSRPLDIYLTGTYRVLSKAARRWRRTSRWTLGSVASS